jgi:uroporphyrinogen decarboxylase
MTDKLHPRERVLAAFNHEIPDRVPVDYHANPGIDAQLKQHFGLAPDDDKGLRHKLGVDFWMINRERPRHYRGPKLFPEVKDRILNEWGARSRYIEHGSGGYWDYVDFPLADVEADDLADWPMPSPDDYDFSGLREECEAHSEFCLFTGHAGVGDMMNNTGSLRGMEQVYIDIIEEEPGFLAFLDRRIEIQCELMRRTIEGAGGLISFMWIGEDLGTQHAPMISLEAFRRVLRPRHQRIIDVAKSFGIPVMIHSCGSSSWAFDDFIEMGIQAVDTLQPEAVNMQPEYLKSKWGDQLAFHGCISTAGPVVDGTVEETVADARHILEVMKPGGGYMFSPTHMLQDNSSLENVLALYETAASEGRYT